MYKIKIFSLFSSFCYNIDVFWQTIESDVISVQIKTESTTILKEMRIAATIFLKNEQTLVIVWCKNALQCPRPLFCSVSSQNQTYVTLGSRQYKASISMGYICKRKRMQFQLFTTHYFINSNVHRVLT